MSKTRALFGLAMAVALPISIQAVSVSAAELSPPAAPAVPQVTPLDATFPLLIDAGSAKAYTDSQARTWRADDGFIGGNVVDRGALEIEGTTDDRIYQTERWGLNGYVAKVPNGKYTVRLHFAETYHDAVASRIFSVKVEDRTIADLDVFAGAGGKNKALVKTLDEVVVADGELNIDFTGAGALVNGIEAAPFVPPPPVVTLSGGSITENAAAGERVATVSAKGASADVFRYALVNSAGRFVIDAQSGVVTVAQGAVLDFETASSHGIEVSATDAKGTVTKQRFTITVVDVNEAPPVVTLSGGSIRENAAAGEPVATVVAKGAAADVFRYALVNSADGRFVIDAQSGVVTVAQGAVLDFETASTHGIEVSATDAKGTATKQRFTITVADVNEAPPVVTLSGGSIRENAAAGEPVATVVAKGAAADVFRYALSNDANGRFTINAQTGAISVAQGAALDFETASSHEIEVSATDAKGTATKQRFTIQVLDVNEVVAQGLKLTHLLAENAPAGTEVAVVAPIDPSITNAVFSLKDNAGGRFQIDPRSGTIRVAADANLDVEKARRHSLTAVATAGSGKVIEQSFEVSLADVNEAPSVLFMSAQSLDETAPAGTVVGIASTVDPDANEKFTYSLVDDAQGRFVIDAATGAVSVAANAKLDPRVAATHRIIIKSTDSAAHSITNGFTLTVRAQTTQAQPTLIEAGSTADHVDAQGRKWTADVGAIGGDIVDRGAIEIAGTTNDRIYQTERYGLTGYALPVTPGLYTVKLHFAETFATAAAARVFSVNVEGQELADIDIFAVAGAKTALVKSVSNVLVTDGKLDIAFTNKTGGTMINAIEVEPVLNCPATAQ